MSYLPPDEAGFFEAVQIYFTEVTDRMALFGARDRALLERWKDEGRPARLVCRGIREAVESYGTDDPPRSLAQCEPFVDDQWEAYCERNTGGHDDEETASGGASESGDRQTGDEQADRQQADSLYERAASAIEEAGKAADQQRWRAAYRRAWRKLQQDHTEGFSFEELEAVDEALVEAYLEALDDEERRAVEEAIASVSSGLLRGMSPSARSRHLHVKRKRELVERFGLLDLLEAID